MADAVRHESAELVGRGNDHLSVPLTDSALPNAERNCHHRRMDAAPDQLDIAIEATDRVISAITDAQLSLPTPCVEWDVRDLVDHIVGGNERFASALGAEGIAPGQAGSAAEMLHNYRHSAALLTEAFHVPGVLDQLVTVPFGTVPGAVALHLRMIDLLVHGWDLAQATGQRVQCPHDLAQQEFQFTTAMLAGMPPEKRPFAPSQPVADDAPAIDRLAACLGRSVSR